MAELFSPKVWDFWSLLQDGSEKRHKVYSSIISQPQATSQSFRVIRVLAKCFEKMCTWQKPVSEYGSVFFFWPFCWKLHNLWCTVAKLWFTKLCVVFSGPHHGLARVCFRQGWRIRTARLCQWRKTFLPGWSWLRTRPAMRTFRSTASSSLSTCPASKWNIWRAGPWTTCASGTTAGRSAITDDNFICQTQR